jgi:hypothetical protein
MDAKDKIAIILEEYKTLRAEILQRTSMLNQIYAVTGTIAAGVLGAMVQYGAIAAGVAMLLALAMLAIFATWLLDHEIRVVATRIRQIETEINGLAESRLLVWETDHGLEPLPRSERMADVIKLIADVIRRASKRWAGGR